jgi:hypothetical protein
METIIKVGIIAAACFGAYVFIGQNFHEAHKFAFGLGGMGFTYLALATGAIGLVAYKAVK